MDLSKTVGQFSDSLFKLLGDNDENTLVSPLSLHIALSMVLLGARNKSESQLKSLLKLQSDADASHVGDYYNSLLTSLNQKDALDIVLIRNKALVSKLFGLRSEYANTLQVKYQSTIKEADFVNNGQRIMDQVNQWVNESTKGMIPSILQSPLDQSTALVLLNCVYFKGNWKYIFKKPYTREFHLDNTRSKEVHFMQVETHFKYFKYTLTSITALRLCRQNCVHLERECADREVTLLWLKKICNFRLNCPIRTFRSYFLHDLF